MVKGINNFGEFCEKLVKGDKFVFRVHGNEFTYDNSESLSHHWSNFKSKNVVIEPVVQEYKEIESPTELFETIINAVDLEVYVNGSWQKSNLGAYTYVVDILENFDNLKYRKLV